MDIPLGIEKDTWFSPGVFLADLLVIVKIELLLFLQEILFPLFIFFIHVLVTGSLFLCIIAVK